MSRPRICIFTETFFPVIGGGETQARLLADGLTAQGHSVMVITRRSDPALPPEEQLEGVVVYRLPPTGRGQLKKWGLLLSCLPVLLRRRHQYDLIFVSGFRIVGVSAMLVARLLAKRCVLKADSQGEMSGEFFRAGLARLRLRPASLPFRAFLAGRNVILRRADAFTAISQAIAAELRRGGVRSESIQMIPNAVDTDRFYPVDARRKASLRRALAIPPASRVVIYTGRLVTYKGLPSLLEVWQEIARIQEDVLLLLVGGGGLDIHNCEAALRSYVAAHALEHRVRFTGEVPHVADFLQAADIFVFPTRDDAFPTSLIEAMVCRLPVVTTPVGAIPEIVVDGQNGLLVPPDDQPALRTALSRLLSDPALLARLGQAARQTVIERYSAVAVTDQYARLFRRLAVDPGTAGPQRNS